MDIYQYQCVSIIVQIATAGVLAVTLIMIWRQFRTTQREFNARTRPYLGFSDIIRKETAKPRGIEFEVFVRNFGTLPAKSAKVYGKFIVDEKEVESFKCPTEGSVFPSDRPEAMWRIGNDEIDEDAILRGHSNLRLMLTIHYHGADGKRYETSTARTYDAIRNDWTDEEGSFK